MVMTCSSGCDPSLLAYEEMVGGTLCTGCGVILDSLMISDKIVESEQSIGQTFVPRGQGQSTALSAAARSAAPSVTTKSSGNAFRIGRRRQRISRLCQVLRLPSWSTDKALLLSTAHPSRAAEVAAVYAVCRQANRSISLSQVCDSANAKRSLIGRALRRLIVPISGNDCARFVPSAITAIKGTFQDEKRALALLEFAFHRGISAGAHPDFVATAAVVVAFRARAPVVLRKVAPKLGISLGVLTKRVKQLEDALVMVAQELPLAADLLITRSNLAANLELILDNIALLDELLAEGDQNNEIEIDYVQALAKFGPRLEQEVEEDGEQSASDLDPMSDTEATEYIRSRREVRELKRLELIRQ